MEEQMFKFGDIVRHRYLSTEKDLVVIDCKEDILTVRYTESGVFYTQELSLYEIAAPFPVRNITKNKGQ